MWTPGRASPTPPILTPGAPAAAVEAALRAAEVLVAVIGTAVAPEPGVQIVVRR